MSLTTLNVLHERPQNQTRKILLCLLPLKRSVMYTRANAKYAVHNNIRREHYAPVREKSKPGN